MNQIDLILLKIYNFNKFIIYIYYYNKIMEIDLENFF